MTRPPEGLDRALVAWVQDGPEAGPDEVLQAALARTRSVRQRPAWLVPQRWLPAPSITARRLPAPLGIALLAALLLVIALVAILITGSQRRLPAPFGPAANGRIVFDTGRGGGVWLANADGSDPRRIIGEGVERSPAFSPDGTLLAFWSRPEPDPDPNATTFSLFVARADGSDPHRIAPAQRFITDPAHGARWSPDSAHLTFFAYGALESGQLWVAPIDGSPAVRITSLGSSATNPIWSPNGEWVAFNQLSTGASTHAITMVHPDGNGIRVLHAQKILGSIDTEAGFGETIRWSPDSRRIAYNRGKDPARDTETSPTAQYLSVIDIDRADSDHAVYAEASGWLHFPVWSPDGRSLAFVVGETTNDIHVVDPDGGADRIVGHCSEPIDSLDWSPDGRWLTMGCPDGAELRPATGSTADVGIRLDTRSRAIDIQRVAP